MRPGDRVIWLRSPGRSFLTGWRIQRIPGVVMKISKNRIRIKVLSDERQRLVYVIPENILSREEEEKLQQERKRQDPVLPAKPSESVKIKKLTQLTPDGLSAHDLDSFIAELATPGKVTY